MARNTNKQVKIGNTTYKMHQVASTGWVFVSGTTSRSKTMAFEVARIVDGNIAEVWDEEAVNGATNCELAEAWLNS